MYMNRNFLFGVVVVIMNLFFVFSSYAQNEPIASKVTAMSFTPDNRKMVTGYEDGTIRIWNEEGKLILEKKDEPKFQSKEIRDLKFSPDGERIIADRKSTRLNSSH